MRKLHARLVELDARIREKVRSLVELAGKIDARITKIEQESGSPEELAKLRKARHDIEETLGKIRFEGITPDYAREGQPR
jgi:hypothetical protein